MKNYEKVLITTIDGLSINNRSARDRVYRKARQVIESKLAKISPPAEVARRQVRAIHDAILNVERRYVSQEDEGQSLPEAGELQSSRVPAPEGPLLGPGPSYEVVDERLTIASSHPSSAEVLRQASLHHRLKLIAERTRELAAGSANRYPALVSALDEYRLVIQPEIVDLNVLDVWAVGAGLFGFHDAYLHQNRARTLADPLEPPLEATLSQLTRVHGAFVMGFEQSAELIRSSDEYGADLSSPVVAQAGDDLLEVFSRSADLVDARTREVHRPIADLIHEFGWSASRNGMAGYRIVENATIATIRYVIGDMSPMGLSLAVITLDPTLEFSRNAVNFLMQHAAGLLTFFQHSPELRGYIAWAIEAVEETEISANLIEGLEVKRVTSPREDFERRNKRNWVNAVGEAYGMTPPATHSAQMLPDILRQVTPFMADNLGHVLLPGSGGLDFSGVQMARERGCLVFSQRDGADYLFKPAESTFFYVPAAPEESFIYIRLQQLAPSGVYERVSTETEFLLELDGQYFDLSRRVTDVMEEETDEELRDAHRVARLLRGSMLLVAKTSIWNSDPGTYDARHEHMTPQAIRDAIERALR